MLNRVNRGYEKMKILICRILKAIHYRVYKCTAILHTPMGRTHGEKSMSKLDNDAKRVANIYMELPCYTYAPYSSMCTLYFSLVPMPYFILNIAQCPLARS